MKKNWIKIAGATFGMAVALQVTPAFADGAEGNLSSTISIEANYENDSQLKEAAKSLVNDVKTEGSEAVSFLRNTVQTEAEQLKSEVEEGKAAVEEKVETVVTDVAASSDVVNGLATNVDANVEADTNGSLSLNGAAAVLLTADNGLNTKEELKGLLNEANQNLSKTVNDVTSEVNGKIGQTVETAEDVSDEIETNVQKTLNQTENFVVAAKDTQASAKAEVIVEATGNDSNQEGVTEGAVNAVTSISLEGNKGSFTAQSDAAAAESGLNSSAEGSANASAVVEADVEEAAIEAESVLQASTVTSTEGKESEESTTGSMEAIGEVKSSVNAEEQTAEANANFESTTEGTTDGEFSSKADVEAAGEIAA